MNSKKSENDIELKIETFFVSLEIASSSPEKLNKAYVKDFLEYLSPNKGINMQLSTAQQNNHVQKEMNEKIEINNQ